MTLRLAEDILDIAEDAVDEADADSDADVDEDEDPAEDEED